MNKEIIKLSKISKKFFVEKKNITVLKNINFKINKGDLVALTGPSGSGKSTLLRLIMGLEKPDEGSIKLGKYNIIPSYFVQNQAEALELKKTVFETLSES